MKERVKKILKWLLAALAIAEALAVSYLFVTRPEGAPFDRLVTTCGTLFVYFAAIMLTAWAAGTFKR